MTIADAGTHAIADLLATTQGLRRSAHLADFRPPEPTRRLFATVIQGALSAAAQPYLRIFLDGGHRQDLTWTARQTRLAADESVEDWMARVLPPGNVCLTLKWLCQASDDFAEHLHDILLRDLVEHLGGLSSGATSYLFAGNYQHTPFGAHTDPENTVLFHLGPAPKRLWVWPQSEGHHWDGGTPSFDLGRMRAHGTCHTLQPGGLFFLAQGDVHMAEPEGFSQTLGLILYPDSPADLWQRAANKAIRELLPVSACDTFDPEHPERLPGGDKVTSIGDGLRHAAIDQRLGLVSNGYVRTPPPLSKPIARWGPSLALRARRHSRIVRTSRADGTYLVRGRTFKTALGYRLQPLVDFIERGSLFEVRELLELASAAPTVPPAQLMDALKALFSLGAVTEAGP